VFVSVIARRLRPGTTYDDFVAAWYPEHGFGVPVRGPYLAVNPLDDREVLAVAFVDVPDADALAAGLTTVSQQESARHDRIDDVIESTSLRAIYEVREEFDFSTDETVERTRPTPGPGTT